jgi:hypothetical protein
MTKSNPKSRDPRRNADLATIHMAAKAMFGDVSRGGHGRDDYEAWLLRLTGVASAGQLSTQGRIDLCRRLRRDGLIPERAPNKRVKGGINIERPTPQQFAKIAALARTLGWQATDDVLDDPCLLAFVRRTVKIDAMRFMTRVQASQVITGLERWVGQPTPDLHDHAVP